MMKRFGFISMAIALLFAVGLVATPVFAQEELPGSNYFGDAGACDGIIDPLDATQMKTQLASSSGGYAGCKPASWQVQDLDGDQNVSPLDYSRLQGWVNLAYPTGIAYSGAPWTLVDGATVIDMGTADTITLEAIVYRRNVSANTANIPGAGWGVVFEVVGGCTAARIEGLDPTPVAFGGKNQTVTEAAAYGYTGAWNGATAAPASVILHKMTCGNTIEVQARIPADSEFGVQGGRFDTQILGALVSVLPGGSVPPATLTVAPSTASINDGETLSLTATHSVDGDVTSAATWGVSGGCTLLSAGLIQAPEGCSAYQCVVTADYSSLSDGATVDVADDDVADTVVGSCSAVDDGEAISCTANYESSADSCDRGAASCTCSDGQGCDDVDDVVDEGCAPGTYTATCGGSTLNDDFSASYTDNDAADAVVGSCSSVDDGDAISCSANYQSSVDGCDRGAASCTCSDGQGCDDVDDVVDEGCAPGTYTATCGGSTLNDDFSASYTDNDAADAVVGSCSSVDDGDAISCSANYQSSVDGCDRGAASCTCSDGQGCDDADNVVDEGCAPGTYTATCGGSTLNDDFSASYTDNDAADAVVGSCSSVDDGDAISCSANYESSVDGCDRGAASCTCSDGQGCDDTDNVVDEGCAPGTYTATCGGSTLNDDFSASYTDNDAADAVVGSCSSVDDGDAISCSANYESSVDGCDRGAASCVCSDGQGCDDVDNVVDEGCAPGTYTATCGGSTLNDDFSASYTDNDAADAVVGSCSSVDDGDAISCSANYESSVDGCDRGAASCVCSDGQGCDDVDNVVDEGCAPGTYTATCGGSTLNDDFSASYTDNDAADAVVGSCSSVDDGDAISCSANYESSVDGCDRGAASCVCSDGQGCDDVDNVVDEGCAPGTYTATCGGAINDDFTASFTDNDAADSVVGSCSDVNDGTAINCTANYESSVDGCDRGVATCLCTDGQGCDDTDNVTDEACGDYTYTATCGGAINDDFTAQAINNETTATVDVQPDSTVTLSTGGSTVFSCSADFGDGCVDDCGASLSHSGVGSFSNPTYSAGSTPGSATISATYAGGYDETDIIVSGGSAPVILSVFPLDYADRFRLNAHVNQNLTVVFDAGEGQPTGSTVTCTSVSDSSVVNFNCNLTNWPDAQCVPTSSYNGDDDYNCSIAVSNAYGNDSASGSLHTAWSSAPSTGGVGGGYVGGLDYDSGASSVGDGTVTLTAVDNDRNIPIAGKVYVQVIQGGTLREYFTDATGNLTMTLDPLPIDEITMGYKCGGERCPKMEEGASLAQYRAGNYSNFAYRSWYGLDASDLALDLKLNKGAQIGRYKGRIQGSIPIASFNSNIAAQRQERARRLFAPPVYLRAAIVIPTLKSTDQISGGLDNLLMTPDNEISISLCLDNLDSIEVALKAALPVNLVAPEIVRNNWTVPCNSWTSNPGKTSWEIWTYTPGENRIVWNVGALANATNFSVTGGLDLFAFPIYGCAIGLTQATVPAGLINGETIIATGTAANFRYNIRENWDNDVYGYDPDTGVNRKILFTVDSDLPIDPARRDSVRQLGYQYAIPNRTDSELGTDWDDRFYRKSQIIASGADFGVGTGIGVTGLSLNIKIDDAEFTIFQVGFFQSSGTKMGSRDIRPWSGSADTEVVSIQHSGLNSTWAEPGAYIDFQARQDGGPTNYAVIHVLSRGSLTNTPTGDAGLVEGGLLEIGSNPGSLVTVWSIGAPESSGNENIRIDDFLNLPRAITPSPDRYIYPAPQWSNTPNNSTTCNRNGELRRDMTTTLAGNSMIADTSDDWNRLFLRFRVNGFVNNTSRTLHAWESTLYEADVMTINGSTSNAFEDKFSAKAKVSSIYGRAYTTGGIRYFQDTQGSYGPRFMDAGVQVGDSLWINSERHNVLNTRRRITGVLSNELLTVNADWSALGLEGDNLIRYRVIRAQARGMCIIDEWAGGPPGGYHCKENDFWSVSGPVLDSATITVHVPDVDPGATTLNGVTGVIPDLFDGIAAGNATQLSWRIATLVYNTNDYEYGGIESGLFDWNNFDVQQVDLAQTQVASDSTFVVYK